MQLTSIKILESYFNWTKLCQKNVIGLSSMHKATDFFFPDSLLEWRCYCRYSRNVLSENVSNSVLSTICDPMDCSAPGSSVHGILQARILKCSHSPLQRIFLTQGSNLGLLHCGQILYHMSHQGSPEMCKGIFIKNITQFYFCLISIPLSHYCFSVFIILMLMSLILFFFSKH